MESSGQGRGSGMLAMNANGRRVEKGRSLHTALGDLRLDRAFVLIPGEARFRLHERVEAVGLTRACTEGLG